MSKFIAALLISGTMAISGSALAGPDKMMDKSKMMKNDMKSDMAKTTMMKGEMKKPAMMDGKDKMDTMKKPAMMDDKMHKGMKNDMMGKEMMKSDMKMMDKSKKMK